MNKFGILESRSGGLTTFAIWLLGFVATAEGIAIVITLGMKSTGWQLAFIRWCLTRAR